MKPKSIFCNVLLILYFGITPSWAQIKGDFLVTVKKDTIPIVVKVNTWDGDLKCTVKGVEKKYGPNEILFYRTGTDNYESALVNAEPNGKKHWTFLLREDYDKNRKMIFLSQIIRVPTDTSGMSLGAIHYCRRLGEKNYKIKSLFTNEDMIDAFSDCPQLVALLKEKRSLEYIEVVNYYLDNTKCK